jgi:hypothetical protein
MPTVTFINVRTLGDSRVTVGAVTADGKVSQQSFASEDDRQLVLNALGAHLDYPPQEFSAAQLEKAGFDPTRLL